MQCRAVLWILGTFCTSSTLGIEAITGLISIHLHLQKLSGKQQLRIATLLSNHTIKSLFENRHANKACSHHFFLKNMTYKQYFKIKSFIVDVNNCLNRIFPLFNTLNSKIFPGSRLIDSFPSHFSFHQANCKDKQSKSVHL